MFRATTRIASATPLSRALPRTRAARRFLSTAPPHQKSRSWKSSATRWGLAGALVYYYNTASAFAEEPHYGVHAPDTSRESETYRTVASISEERKAQARVQSPQTSDQTQTATVSTVADGEVPAPGSPEALEEEASEQGAFNEETGEINWDCPCLGGMAYGPCGEQFRAAFSCFVFSQEEPKGVDCIEHFKTMQNCFREHPDVYGAELEDDDEEGTAVAIEGETAPVPSEPTPQTSVARSEAASLSNDKTSQQPLVSSPSPTAAVSAKPEQGDLSTAKADEDNEVLVQKAWHDSRDSTPAK